MPKINADEIVTQQHKRIFRQPGGARPNKTTRYAGVNDQYLSVMGLSSPVRGDVSPINVPDPYRRKGYRQVGSTEEPPDYTTATLHVLEKHGSIPFQLGDLSCAFNLYLPSGRCKDPSDFLGGWEDCVEILGDALVTDRDPGDRTAWDSDEQSETELGLTIARYYAIGAMAFGEQAANEVSREVVGITYDVFDDCTDCPDTSQRIYAVTKSSGGGSPGLPAEVVYHTETSGAWSQSLIDGFGATEDPLAIKKAGIYLIVLGSNAYYISEVNRFTGVPGTWTKISNGFVAAKDPQDIYVAGPNEVYFCGLGGYMYKSTDLTVGVTVVSAGDSTTANLYRVKGAEDTIVAVGASATVLYSVTRGQNWSTATTAPTALALTISAVEVLDNLRWWVGTQSSGRLIYTLTGGENWVQKEFSGSGSGTIRDILFSTNEVGFFSHDTSAPVARIFASWNGGADWTKSQPRILNMPVYNRATRLAVPGGHETVSSNNLAIGGLGANGTDGIILLGIADIL